MILLKPTVRFKKLRPEIYNVFPLLQGIWFEHAEGAELVITSANDSTHSAKSLHYHDLALDLRSKNVPVSVKMRLLKEMKERLVGYDVILEHFDKENEHFHLEYDPK